MTDEPIVDIALGKSLFYNEYKGNFNTAAGAAETALHVARASSDAYAVARALYAKGWVHRLRGEYQAAIHNFQQARQTVDNIGRLALWSWDAEGFTHFLRLHCLPDSTAPQITEVLTRWNNASIFPPAYRDTQERHRILQTVAPHEQSSLQQVIDEILTQHLLFSVPLSDQAHRYGQASILMSRIIELLHKRVPFNAITEEERVTAGYITRLMAQSYFWGGFPHKAFELAATAENTFSQLGDEIALAAILLDKADWSAAPGSSPLHCGLIVRDMAGYNSRDSVATEWRSRDHNRANYESAHQLADKARHLFAQHNAPRGVAAANLRLGYIHWRQGQLAHTAAFYQQAQAGFEDTGDTLNLRVTRIHQALLAIARQHYPEDRPTAAAVGRWGQEAGAPAFTYGLGQLCSQMGREWLTRDYERALACYRLAESVFSQLQMPYYTAQSIVDQAEAFLAADLDEPALGRYYEAMERFEQVAQEPFPLATLASMSVLSLGSSLYHVQVVRGDGTGIQHITTYIEKHAKRLYQVLALANTTPEQDTPLIGTVTPDMIQTVLIGVTPYMAQGPVWRLLSEADAKREQGYPEEAEHLYQQALESAERMDNALARYKNCAYAYAHMRRYDEAIAHFRQYLALESQAFQQTRAQWGSNIIANTQAHSITTRAYEGILKHAMRFYVACQAYQEAGNIYTQLEQSAGAEWWRQEDKPWESLLDLGTLHAGIGEYTLALTEFDAGIRLQEERRREVSRDQIKVSLASSIGVSALYLHAARTCLQMNEVARSWECAERGRGRALLDLMTSGATMGEQPQDVRDDIQRWRQLNTELTVHHGLLALERRTRNPDPQWLKKLACKVRQSEQALTQVEEALATSNPAFYRVINPHVEVTSLDQAQHALPSGTLMISYLLRERYLIGWAVNHDGIVHTFVTEIDTRGVTGAVNRFLHAIAAVGELHTTNSPTQAKALADQRQTCEDLAKYLGALLLKPFALALQQHDHLVIIPDGVLHKLPFAALMWEGIPLCASHSLSFTPSASVLLQAQAKAKSSGGAQRQLAVGIRSGAPAPLTPGSTPVELPPLRMAEVEAKAVASVCGGRPLLGEEATAETIRQLLPDFTRIHLAIHGIAYEQMPLASVLCLQDKPLSLYELFGMNMAAELVVLSACRTGTGTITRGGEVFSFARGLLAAGAKAVVVSLWPVDDTATALFMVEFYRQLAADKSAAEALQLAQTYLRTLPDHHFREARHQLRALARGEVTERSTADVTAPQSFPLFADTYYWAPFVLIGS